MNKFINREKELAALEEKYNSSKSELVVIYGRRRLGKTTLIRNFVKKLPHVYFMADRAGEEISKSSLALTMSEALAEPLLESIKYPSWYDLFAAFDKFRSKNKKTVLILDEFQYLCQMQPAFASFIQKWWDEHWKNSNILLILCGSVTSMMYKETLAENSPLYGRASVQLLISPLRFKYLKKFMPKLNHIELIKFYSLTGGIPRYIELAGEYKDFKTALKKLVLNRTGILYNEAKYILHDEIYTPNTCWSILNALGSGTTRISELGSKLNLPTNQLTRYIDLLKDLFLVYREVPVLETNPAKSKKGIYKVSDPFLRLWFGCIYPYESFLEFEQPDLVMKKIGPQLLKHISFCYEDICRDLVKEKMLDFNCFKIGRQWSKNYEIDIAGVNEKNEITIIGECKWSNKKIGLSLLKELKNKITDNNLPAVPNYKCVFFSKSGFTKDLLEKAESDKSIILI